jgi:hypothetical protein
LPEGESAGIFFELICLELQHKSMTGHERSPENTWFSKSSGLAEQGSDLARIS